MTGCSLRLTRCTTRRFNMLRDTDAVATLAVRNLTEAVKFYEKTLGLSRAGAEDDEVVVFESGDTRIKSV
jgi:catechol-2,3-dioxygenase